MRKIWAGVGRFSMLSLLVYLYFAVGDYLDAVSEVSITAHEGIGIVYMALVSFAFIVAVGIFIIIDWFKS